MNPNSEFSAELALPPLSVYVHLPWCVRKCPYCDFNSHEARGDIPDDRYVAALLADLENDLPRVWGRPVHSVFFGGGTPSLFSAAAIGRIIDGLRSRLNLVPGAEITLEANPGTVEHDCFEAYRDAGINRVSLGAQSFDDEALRRIGRIHGASEIDRAVESLHRAGLANFNLDLMFGLPGQTVAAAVEDVDRALAHDPAHVSHYQLTLEPNTAFHARPPRLPGESACWAMQEQAADRLQAAGFGQYEISAWARSGAECRHNLNYWRYGDYLGIGAGAHGKVTLPAEGVVMRGSKQRHPRAYLEALDTGRWLAETRAVPAAERVFEFFLNQLRLRDGVRATDFGPRTGLPWSAAEEAVEAAIGKGLLEWSGQRLIPTGTGWRFVNETQALFLPGDPA
ncbi:radical SAM family heme chaperone HemW [Elongatibacter sediminis]|uniref:Heme chaperone HemW n=1 Tax=Elongatibacter sediminis TaxID=3119006 RepID=A0AAW9RI32_9GAMM